jgi:nucleotide-binding universal stress UspA family protein
MVSQTLSGVPGLDADLIVMATHRRGAIRRFLFHGFAHSLLQRISVPLILVRGNNSSPTYESQNVEHVLLPCNDTDDSKKVLQAFRDVNYFPTASLILLRTVRLDPKYLVKGYSLHTKWEPSHRRSLIATEHLQLLAQPLRDCGRQVHIKVVSSDGQSNEALLRCAEENNVGVIALPYRRRRILARLFLPETSEYMLRAATCPLMLVPVETP